jgi:hypothetical protein
VIPAVGPADTQSTIEPAQAVPIEMTAHMGAVDVENQMDHSHLPIAVPQGVPVPGLSIDLSKDGVDGLSL